MTQLLSIVLATGKRERLLCHIHDDASISAAAAVSTVTVGARLCTVCTFHVLAYV